MKQRLDQVMVTRGLVRSRSQAESWIGLGKVLVNGTPAKKAGQFVAETDTVKLTAKEQYVSRAGLKLASVARALGLDFSGKIVLDVGSSTGGFTDYALQHGANKVIAVDVGTEQLHPSLRGDKRIELYEKTDIRAVIASSQAKSAETASRRAPLALAAGETRAADVSSDLSASGSTVKLQEVPDIVVMDVSFISLRDILPHIATLSGKNTEVVAMLKPQFEAGKHQVNKGVIKNDSVRRQILKEFEAWVKHYFVVVDKSDSEVAGSKGNRERFYLLKSLR